jgi:hypothetical protein
LLFACDIVAGVSDEEPAIPAGEAVSSVLYIRVRKDLVRLIRQEAASYGVSLATFSQRAFEYYLEREFNYEPQQPGRLP